MGASGFGFLDDSQVSRMFLGHFGFNIFSALKRSDKIDCSPITEQSCLNTLKSQYVAKLLKEELNEQLYEAEIAGLGYSIQLDGDTLIFNVDGYNQKLSLLLETVLSGLASLKVNRQKFELVKDSQERRYKNFMLDGPVGLAGYWLEASLLDVHYTYEEKLEALKGPDLFIFSTCTLRLRIPFLSQPSHQRILKRIYLNYSSVVLSRHWYTAI